jgi:hypothetical protein
MKPTKLKHIILDFDETLAYVKIDKNNQRISKITFRPYLWKFIRFLFKNFKSVSIWTSAKKHYINMMIEYMKPYFPKGKKLRFVYTFDDCKIKYIFPKFGFYCNYSLCCKTIAVKPLEKVFDAYEDMTRFNTIIIDDNEHMFSENYENAIWIKPFKGSKKDNCLIKVAENLTEIKLNKINFLDWKNRTINWNKKSNFKF